jgi:hypothetical protein
MNASLAESLYELIQHYQLKHFVAGLNKEKYRKKQVSSGESQ